MHLLLKGIIPPLVTPLEQYDKLDNRGLNQLIEHLILGGVHSIFILGTNGESASLSLELRKQLIKETGRLINQRIPFITGITDTSIKDTIDLARYAYDCGSSAVVISPPFYYPLDQEEVLTYFETLTPELPLPYYIYNIPSHTKISLTLDTVLKIKKLGAIGIKDSSGNLTFLQALLETFHHDSDFAVFTGTELFLPDTMMNGGDGAIPGGANLFPHLFVRYYNASKDKDPEQIDYLRGQVMKLNDTIYNVSKHPSAITMGIKCALSVMGICNDYAAPPLNRLNREERMRIKDFLAQFSHDVKEIQR